MGVRVPPRLILLEYRGDDSNPDRFSAVIGKVWSSHSQGCLNKPQRHVCVCVVKQGICFDSGGLNLKPTGSIETMHFDKGGAAAVLGAAYATAKLKPRCNAGNQCYNAPAAGCDGFVGGSVCFGVGGERNRCECLQTPRNHQVTDGSHC
jgi:Cytosol aminopeptidase family, catalytic domain